jgi:hypothetical protein
MMRVTMHLDDDDTKCYIGSIKCEYPRCRPSIKQLEQCAREVIGPTSRYQFFTIRPDLPVSSAADLIEGNRALLRDEDIDAVMKILKGRAMRLLVVRWWHELNDDTDVEDAYEPSKVGNIYGPNSLFFTCNGPFGFCPEKDLEWYRGLPAIMSWHDLAMRFLNPESSGPGSVVVGTDLDDSIRNAAWRIVHSPVGETLPALFAGEVVKILAMVMPSCDIKYVPRTALSGSSWRLTTEYVSIGSQQVVLRFVPKCPLSDSDEKCLEKQCVFALLQSHVVNDVRILNSEIDVTARLSSMSFPSDRIRHLDAVTTQLAVTGMFLLGRVSFGKGGVLQKPSQGTRPSIWCLMVRRFLLSTFVTLCGSITVRVVWIGNEWMFVLRYFSRPLSCWNAMRSEVLSMGSRSSPESLDRCVSLLRMVLLLVVSLRV